MVRIGILKIILTPFKILMNFSFSSHLSLNLTIWSLWFPWWWWSSLNISLFQNSTESQAMFCEWKNNLNKTVRQHIFKKFNRFNRTIYILKQVVTKNYKQQWLFKKFLHLKLRESTTLLLYQHVINVSVLIINAFNIINI